MHSDCEKRADCGECAVMRYRSMIVVDCLDQKSVDKRIPKLAMVFGVSQRDAIVAEKRRSGL